MKAKSLKLTTLFSLSHHLLATAAAFGIVVFPAALPAADNEALYALSPFFEQQRLWRIDPNTGLSTLLGPTGVNTLIGVASDGAGRLLAVDAAWAGNRTLFELNPASGQANARFNLGAPQTFFEGDIAVDPTTGLAYVVEEDDFYSIDLSTGVLTSLGNLTLGGTPLGGDVNIDALAFRNGTLYGFVTIQSGSLNNDLIVIDKNTLAVTDIGDVGLTFGGTAGMAYSPSRDTFYLAGSDVPGLYSVDPVSAHATLIGNHGLLEVSGLTLVVVPEPGSLALGVLGLMGLCGYWAVCKYRRQSVP